jgi:hypothetical protein
MRIVLSLCVFAITLSCLVLFVTMLKPDVIKTATSPQHATSIISAPSFRPLLTLSNHRSRQIPARTCQYGHSQCSMEVT